MNIPLGSWQVDIMPLLPLPVLAALGGMIALTLCGAMLFYRRGIVWRLLCGLLLTGALLNPSIVEEKREGVKDVAVMVIDDSPSQRFGNREEITKKTADLVMEAAKNLPDLEMHVVHATSSDKDTPRTDLFSAATRAYGDTPASRRAGIIMVTDGQVHDAPKTGEETGPIHILLSGEKNETDRQLVITQAPGYGIVGQNVSVSFKVLDTPAGPGEPVRVILRRDQENSEVLNALSGEEHTIDLPIHHGGKNIFELEVAPKPGELTDINNKSAIVINGVRDRLRVLLVSGRPHMGGRTWRNLLTSDPAVDLVHFTILRDPQKLDMTPQKELSLIPFPFHELFEVKLNEFDLIIFDRYSLNKILPPYYFENIAHYIENGGALLEASGPEYAGTSSLFETALGPVLPGRPTGTIVEQAFKPALTDMGLRHPVTEELAAGQKDWGAWLRQVDLRATPHSDTLMTGMNGTPLLLLDHVGKGRVAQLASDQIWLWSRGYDGGGPQGQLLRRLAHWLMKEPELEEELLELTSDGDTLLVRRRSLHDKGGIVTLTYPDGTRTDVTLQNTPDSLFLQARVNTTQPGVYAATDGTLKTLAVIGNLDSPEYKALIADDTPTKTFALASGGSSQWIGDGIPALRQIQTGRKYAGRNWIGLKKNNDYTVTGIKSLPLLPAWVLLLLLGGSAVWSWWQESRT
jgi:hypothetical protein